MYPVFSFDRLRPRNSDVVMTRTFSNSEYGFCNIFFSGGCFRILKESTSDNYVVNVENFIWFAKMSC